MAPNRILPIALVILSLAATTRASEQLPVRNDTNRVMQLWIYPYAVRQWRRPIRFAPSERKVVYFNSGERYYLVFMDDQGRETPIGRYNISDVLQQDPTYEVSIRSITVCAPPGQVKYVWRRYQRRWYRIPYGVPRAPEVTYHIQWLGSPTYDEVVP